MVQKLLINESLVKCGMCGIVLLCLIIGCATSDHDEQAESIAAPGLETNRWLAQCVVSDLNAEVSCAKYSHDGETLVVCTRDFGQSTRRVFAFDTQTWKCTWNGDISVVGLDVEFSPDDDLFLVRGSGGTQLFEVTAMEIHNIRFMEFCNSTFVGGAEVLRIVKMPVGAGVERTWFETPKDAQIFSELDSDENYYVATKSHLVFYKGGLEIARVLSAELRRRKLVTNLIADHQKAYFIRFERSLKMTSALLVEENKTTNVEEITHSESSPLSADCSPNQKEFVVGYEDGTIFLVSEEQAERAQDGG